MATATKLRRAKQTKLTPLSNAPKVYSYIRFSTPEQAEGDSERRQVEKAKLWAEKHGHTFDQSLRADLGRSGYSGAHRKKGNLGKFLQRVEAGEVPRGSILVVEELRRLTREGLYVSLKEIFEKLWDAGITIQTLQPEYTYTRETCENDLATSVTLTLLLQLAREESRQKSEWGNSAWKHKREDAKASGKMLTSMAPEWFERTTGADNRRKLVLGKDGKPVAIPNAAKSVIMAFQLRAKKLGPGPIARHLNAKAPWSPPPKKKKGGKPGETTEGWNASYVRKILQSRAVIGECQPCRKVNGKRVPDGDPIPNHWPNLFAKHPGLFEQVQQINKANAGKCKGGRNDKANNVLQKLVKCAYCKDGAMHFLDKGNGWTYLKCANGLNGKTKCKDLYSSIRYMDCETAVIEQSRRLRPEQVLPNDDEQAKLCDSLRQRLQRQTAVELSIQDKIDSVKEQIKVSTNAKRRAEYETWLDDYDAELADAKKQTADTESELQKAEQGRKTLENWQANIESLQKALGNGDVELRQRMNAHLREFIDHIEVFTDGLPPEYDGDDFGDHFYAVVADHEHTNKRSLRVGKQQREFVQWAMAQQRTKAGRFLRVHYKVSDAWREQMRKDFGDCWTGYFDVVPANSVGGKADIESLWNQYKSKKNRGVR